MRLKLLLAASLALAPVAALTTLSGCEKKAPAPAPTTKTDKHDHDHDDKGHDHGHGAAIALGEQEVGGFTAKVTRDEGKIVAGKEAAIDVTVTPRSGSTAKATAVRFWIGTQDAKGSVKAKADIEDPKEPNRWHTHAEVPNPLPAGSKLWVEIEDDKGTKSVAGFDLKM